MYTGRKRDSPRSVEHMRPKDLGIGKLFEDIDAVVAEAETQRIGVWNPTAERASGCSASEVMRLCVEVLAANSPRRRLGGREQAGSTPPSFRGSALPRSFEESGEYA
jgi:hypothetical protein